MSKRLEAIYQRGLKSLDDVYSDKIDYTIYKGEPYISPKKLSLPKKRKEDEHTK